MKPRTKKIIRNSFLWTVALTTGLYFTSPKIGYLKHKIANQITDTLWTKDILADKETNDIINLMAGKITKEEFDEMIQRHGQHYTKYDVNFEQVQDYDPYLYQVILAIQTKYGNPTISFSGSFFNPEQWSNEPTRSRYGAWGNTIHLHQLDSLMLGLRDFWDEKDKVRLISGFDRAIWYRWRREQLIGNWLAELCHAKQTTERWAIQWSMDVAWNYLKTPLNYPKQYDLPWTVEYQAHSEYEPVMAKEFVELYEKYTANKPQYRYKLAKLHGWYFEKYSDMSKTLLYLHKASDQWDSLATFVIGKYFFEFYQKHYGYTTWIDTTAREKIWDKIYTMEELFQQAMRYYKKAYKQGMPEAGVDIINICQNYVWDKYDDFIIEFGEEFISKYGHGGIDEFSLGSVYSHVWNAYSRKWVYEKANEYVVKASACGYRDGP